MFSIMTLAVYDLACKSKNCTSQTWVSRIGFTFATPIGLPFAFLFLLTTLAGNKTSPFGNISSADLEDVIIIL
jgi:hypothetical protein